MIVRGRINDDGASQDGRNDAAAFEALFHAYYGALCTFAWGFVQSRDEAEDLVQEVFVNLWDKGEWEAATIKPYLYRAVRNRALNNLEHRRIVRKEEAYVQLQAPFRGRMADEEMEYEQLCRFVDRVVSGLPERRREIFLLHRRDGLTYREIAVALNITVKTVQTQIGRSLDALRRSLMDLTLHA